MASTYRVEPPQRIPARKRSLFAQCCCQRGSSTLGPYRSCTLPPSDPAACGLAPSPANPAPPSAIPTPCGAQQPGQVPEPSRPRQVASAIERWMESQVYVGDIARHEGQEVLLRGWLYGKRSSGKLHFVQLRDGTGTIQCVVSRKDVPEAAFAAAE